MRANPHEVALSCDYIINEWHHAFPVVGVLLLLVGNTKQRRCAVFHQTSLGGMTVGLPL